MAENTNSPEWGRERIQALKTEIARIVVGQNNMVERAIIALLTGGHILLEGMPGLAKTLLCNTLAHAIDCQFKRIQFTPDLLPADLIGSLTYRQDNGTFYAKKGPIFANLVLADEINRAPAKVQSALLEAMQEKQVTIGDETYPLPRPFLVVATQNPIDQEGTYALPEAQIDRFMLKVIVDYPSPDEEKTILDRILISKNDSPQMILSQEDLSKLSLLIESIYIDDRVRDYIVRIIDATRHPDTCGLAGIRHEIARGSSPRGTLSLAAATRAYAFINGRDYTTPDDVQQLVHDVLRHRIALTYEAQADDITSDDIISKIIEKIEVP